MPEYLAYWGFARAPFSLAPDPSMLAMTGPHTEALQKLEYAIASQKGGALLISENAGNGKTSLLLKLRENLLAESRGRARVAYVDHPTLTPVQLLGEIGLAFGITRPSQDKARLLQQIRERTEQLRGQGIPRVAIVDEGQMLVGQPALLEELRTLLNLTTPEGFLLTFIFSGQKPLEGVLREMPEFWQRLPVRCFLTDLNLRDSRELVLHRIRQAGVETRSIFTEAALEALHDHSGGCPRVLCALADFCLLFGAGARVRAIDTEEVKRAAHEMEGGKGEDYAFFRFSERRERRPDAPASALAPPPVLPPAPPMPLPSVPAPARPEAAPSPPAAEGAAPPSPAGPSPLLAEPREPLREEEFVQGLGRIFGSGGKPYPGSWAGRASMELAERSLFLVPGRSGLRRNLQLHFEGDKAAAGSLLATSAGIHLVVGSRAVAVRYGDFQAIRVGEVVGGAFEMVLEWAGNRVRVRCLRLEKVHAGEALRLLRRWIVWQAQAASASDGKNGKAAVPAEAPAPAEAAAPAEAPAKPVDSPAPVR